MSTPVHAPYPASQHEQQQQHESEPHAHLQRRAPYELDNDNHGHTTSTTPVDASHAPPPYSRSRTPSPSSQRPLRLLPSYTDADNELITISIPESQLLGPAASTQGGCSSSKSGSGFLKKLSKLTQPNPVRIVVMTRGDYVRYWARDGRGRYVGVEDEGEGPRIWREKMAGRVVGSAAAEGAGAATGTGVGAGVTGGEGGQGAQGPVAVAAGTGAVASDRKSEAVERQFRAIETSGGRRVPGGVVGADGRKEGLLKRGLRGPTDSFKGQTPGIRSVWAQHPTS